MQLIILCVLHMLLIPCENHCVTATPSLAGKWFIKKITLFNGSVKLAGEGKGCLAKSYVIFDKDGMMYNQWFFEGGTDSCFAAKIGSSDYRIEDGNRIVSSDGSARFVFKDNDTLVIQFDRPKKGDSKITFNFQCIEYTRAAK